MLGNRTNLAEAQAKGVAVNRAATDAFAANVLPVVCQIQAAGATAHRAIAAALNTRGIRTARGGDWHVSTVQNLLAREGVLQRLGLWLPRCVFVSPPRNLTRIRRGQSQITDAYTAMNNKHAAVEVAQSLRLHGASQDIIQLDAR
jgi:hypothetical protein